jgi:hypothetical protein
MSLADVRLSNYELLYLSRLPVAKVEAKTEGRPDHKEWS